MEKLIVLRISGKVDLDPDEARTLAQLGLKKKFSCTVVDNKKEYLGMLHKVKHCISYGHLKAETLRGLLLKRAKKGKNRVKLDESKIETFIEAFMAGRASFNDLGINKIFTLHPPRGGLKKSSKLLWPRGILGKNEKINELITRML